MRIRIKVTDLTEQQWNFVFRYVIAEYPLDGTAVRVCYEFLPQVEFNSVMPLAKFNEIQEHLGYLDKFGHPFVDCDDQDDFERENAPSRQTERPWVRYEGMNEPVQARVEDDQDKARQILDLINGMITKIDEMRAELREAGRA